jgi:rhodanese-related sulfurtransferase
MERRKTSITPDALYAQLGSEAAPITVNVRRDTDFSSADRLVADAFHCSPESVEEWRTRLPNGCEVVTYCANGQQGVAAALRLMGVEANFLGGGIAGGPSGECPRAETSVFMAAVNWPTVRRAYDGVRP